MDLTSALELAKALGALGPFGILLVSLFLVGNGFTLNKQHKGAGVSATGWHTEFDALKDAFNEHRINYTREIGELRGEINLLKAGARNGGK